MAISQSYLRRDGRTTRATELQTVLSKITKKDFYKIYLEGFGSVRLVGFTHLPEIGEKAYFVVDRETNPGPNLVDWLYEGENEDYLTQLGRIKE